MAKQDMVNLKKLNILLIAFVLLFIFLLLPTFIRFYQGNDSLIGGEPYYHFRAARELLKAGEINLFDTPEGVEDISHSPRDYFFNPYHYFLVYLSQFISLATASRIVPFIFGIMTVLVFNLLLKRFYAEDYKRHIMLVMLVMSPAFIYTFTVSNPHCAALFFSLLGFYLFLRDDKFYFALSVISFIIVSFFSLFNTLLIMLVLLAYVVTKRERQNRFIVAVLVLALVSFANRIGFYYNYSYSPEMSIISDLLADLGGVIGFGSFAVILAVYGVVSLWRIKGRFMAFLIIALLLLASLLYIGNIANMYLMFFVSVAAGAGFVRLYESRWSEMLIKNLALLILICGLIFSSASFMTRLANMEPSAEMIESVEWLADNAFKDEFVLSHYDEGFLISSIARNPVLTDSYHTSGYDQGFLYKVQDTIFHARKLDDVKPLLDAYDIKYVYITPEMMQGKVWSRDDEGLLFLFTSQSTFENVYDKDGYQIWKVLNTTVTTTII